MPHVPDRNLHCLYFLLLKTELLTSFAMSFGFISNFQWKCVGFKVKMMEESDVHACSELHKSVLGHERETDIRELLQTNPGNSWVAVKDDILQYAYQELFLVFLVNYSALQQ
jgi:hypothetical protein